MPLSWCWYLRRRGKALKNFRPKSLVSNLHKLLAKVLKNRLNKVVKNSCFKFTECSAEGKQILELSNKWSYLFKVEEWFDGIICKFDIEKPTIRINWAFPLEILDTAFLMWTSRWLSWVVGRGIFSLCT